MTASFGCICLTSALTLLTSNTMPEAVRPAEPPLAMAELRLPVAMAETLAVSLGGEGPVVVLLSGSIGSAYTWRQVTAALLADGHRVLTIDPLGMGRSARPRQADYSLEAQAERVRVALDSMNVSAGVIVAHGVSGSIAMRLALAHPDRVMGLVSVEGGPAERAGSAGIKKALAFAPLLRLFGGRGMIRGKIRNGLRDGSGDPGWVTEEVVARYAEGPTADLGATLRTLKAMADAREPLALGPRLGALELPTIFLLGGAMHTGGPSEREVALLRASVRGAEFVRVDGAGHYLQEERPDEVLGAIRTMVARVRRLQCADVGLGGDDATALRVP